MDSFKTGLRFSLVLAPKLVLKVTLTALGLVLVNTMALFAPYLAWQIWFPKKHSVVAVAQKDNDKSPEDDGHNPSTLPTRTPDLDVFGVCFSIGMGITLIEGLVIICMADDTHKMSSVMRAGHFAAVTIGVGTGVGLVVLFVGGCANFFVSCLGKDANGHVKEKAGKGNGEGWERVEVGDKEREKDDSQER